MIVFEKNASGYVVCKIVACLSRPQWAELFCTPRPYMELLSVASETLGEDEKLYIQCHH